MPKNSITRILFDKFTFLSYFSFINSSNILFIQKSKNVKLLAKFENIAVLR